MRNVCFKTFLLCLTVLFGWSTILGQDGKQDLYDMSLEELMNMTVVSASRAEEDVFKAPLSSYVISAKEIALSGATSVPDALRLCPAVIVREISNGTYDVSLRGGVDGLPVYNYSYINTTTLVMINNRPVFSYLQGGTYWQNLPVGISEIDRIEVVLGPSSPLYGPNAVSGVINIITNKTETSPDEMMIHSNIAAGPYSTNGSLTAGKGFSERLAVDASVNFTNMQMFEDQYYDPRQLKYVAFDSTIFSNSTEKYVRFPDPSKSLESFGGSVNLYIDPHEDLNLFFGAGLNTNMGLMPLTSTLSMANFSNQSKNISFLGKFRQFSLQASYLEGRQGLSGNVVSNFYNYENYDIYADYQFVLMSGKLLLTPALNYQYAYANDKEYTLERNLSGTFNGEGHIDNIAASMKLDATPINNLRVIIAGRYDKSNYPESHGNFSYQGIVNYGIGENHIIRLLTGKSYNGSFLVPTLINSSNPIGPGMQLSLRGNEDLDLISNRLLEAGYKARFGNRLSFDLAYFNQYFTDFNVLVLQTPQFNPGINALEFTYLTENIPLQVKQNGVTFTLQSTLLSGKVQVRPHLTFQKTQLEKYSPYYNVQGAFDNPGFNYYFDGRVDSTWNTESELTPSVWGGFNLIVKPVKRITIDISGYYYDDYKLHILNEVNTMTGQIVDQPASAINSKFRLNANFSVNISEGLHGYLNIRNLTDADSPEAFGSSYLGRSFLVGLRINI